MKTIVWSVATYAAETWTITKQDEKVIQAFEMWCWRRFQRISYLEHKTNEAVLHLVNESRQLLQTIEKRRHHWIGHLLRHDNNITSIIEGMIEGKLQRGRKRVQYFDAVKRYSDMTTYTQVKQLAMKREDWKKKGDHALL